MVLEDINRTPVHDFQFNCLSNGANLPGKLTTPPNSLAALSAQTNAKIVARFLVEVLNLKSLDSRISMTDDHSLESSDSSGLYFISTVNCVHTRCPSYVHSRPNIWRNAQWRPWSKYHPNRRPQVVYGQIETYPGELISFASSLTIVAHEFFHGVTHFSAKLGCRYGESGALNESYSDIFAVIVANRHQPYISQWNWEIGEPITNCGFPVRNIKCPHKYHQAAHLDEYVEEQTYIDDQGKVRKESNIHHNNGIHNRAAYNIIIAQNDNQYLFNRPGDLKRISTLFYRGLIGILNGENAAFKDSRESLVKAIPAAFENDDRQYEIEQAIRNAFNLVGIPL
jgi:Zn-dependent metalloprotease